MPPTPAEAPLASSPNSGGRVLVIGGGPAGLMAAEGLLAGGMQVDLFDAMPSVGRKFLLAGKGGLNLTHAEPAEDFVRRFRTGAAPRAFDDPPDPHMAMWMQVMNGAAVRTWAEGLGIPTFVGSSGKVFPQEMKAAPLLRAWLHRLRRRGLRLHVRHRWTGALAGGSERRPWRLAFDTPSGPIEHAADAVVLALGGGSWSRLGSDGAWQPWLAGRGVEVSPLKPANCGFNAVWSEVLRSRHAGAPLKGIGLHFTTAGGRRFERLGEAVVTEHGLEGSLMYAAGADLRELIERDGFAEPALDLLPHRSVQELTSALSGGRGARSWTNHLKAQTGLSGVKAALLREGASADAWAQMLAQPAALAARIKALPVRLVSPRPLDEAISSAGGVRFAAFDDRVPSMLYRLPGVFCAGEMVDWEAPTGGYLLTACLASGRAAARDVIAWSRRRDD